MSPKKALFLLASAIVSACRTPDITSPGEDRTSSASPPESRVDWCAWFASVQPLPNDWKCLEIPGYHSIGGFGTKEFPLQTTFDACDLDGNSLPQLFTSDPPYEKTHEYSSSLAVKAGVSVDLSILRVPFLGGISVSTNIDRTVTISVKVLLKQTHLKRLTNLPLVFSKSPNASHICQELLCDSQSYVTAEVLAAAPEIILESSSEFTVATGVSILKIVKAHGSVEKDTSTKNTLAAPSPVVLASHQSQAFSYAGSLCAPTWTCASPSIRIHADCEQGKLGAKEKDDRTIDSFGTHSVGTRCAHDAPNQGHAQISVGCAVARSQVSIDYSVDLFAKGGFTNSHDCKDAAPDDKCFTQVGFQTLAGEAFVDIPSTGAYDIRMIGVSECSDLLQFIDARGKPVQLRPGDRYKTEPGRFTARLAGQKTFKQGSTDEDRYQPHCKATLQVENSR